MARATDVTKLSLTEWARIMGIHPLLFESVFIQGIVPTATCQTPWLQYSWQSADRVSREEVAMAIAEAEAQIEGMLGYRLCPSWEKDEWQPTIRPYRPELINLSVTDLRGYGQVARANWGHFITGGMKAKNLIIAAHAITWSAPDAVGYKETGTVDHATTVIDPCEIAIYYPGKAGADEWEIRPTNVTIAGGIATITFRRELCVLEALLESLSAQGVEGTDDANFLTTVDVYRRYNDPQAQVSFLWEPTGCSICDGAGCASCSYAIQSGCLMMRGNPRNSLVVYQPAEWNSATLDFDSVGWAVERQPDLVRLYYLAGLRDKDLICSERDMSLSWKQTVAAFAASKLARPTCDCETAHDRVERWRQDLAFSSGAEELASYSLSSEDLSNPFGTRRGAIQAWKQVQREALGDSV
jgi:hypothetical protein